MAVVAGRRPGPESAAIAACATLDGTRAQSARRSAVVWSGRMSHEPGSAARGSPRMETRPHRAERTYRE
jgi:hypothetical protein